MSKVTAPTIKGEEVIKEVDETEDGAETAETSEVGGQLTSGEDDWIDNLEELYKMVRPLSYHPHPTRPQLSSATSRTRAKGSTTSPVLTTSGS